MNPAIDHQARAYRAAMQGFQFSSPHELIGVLRAIRTLMVRQMGWRAAYAFFASASNECVADSDFKDWPAEGE